MADDVKVKFGGDFTDVPKGAEAAANAAGTAMRGWFGKYANSLKDKLASAFSLENIVGKFVSSVGEQLEKFKEIDTLSRKLGVSREELQKFGKIGKEFNLDMETMGRSIQFANKTLGAAAMGNKEAEKKLQELGFTQKEVTSGHIKATDVLYRLADAYEQNKKARGSEAANNILAKQTTDLFGRSGADLVSILKEGNQALQDRIKLLNVYSEAEVKAGAAAQRQAERSQAIVNKMIVGKFISGFFGNIEQHGLFGLGGESGFFGGNIFATGEGGIMGQALEKSGFKSRSDVKSKEDIDKLTKNFVELGKGVGARPEDLERIIQTHIEESKFTIPFTNIEISSVSDKNQRLFDEMKMRISDMAHEDEIQESRTNKIDTTSIKDVAALTASSLQQIGGGDITSVMSGLTNNEIADNTRRTADATERIANQEAPKPGSQTLR